MSVTASGEAMRIVRTLKVHFPTGPEQSGSAFIADGTGKLITCAHVVTSPDGHKANRIIVSKPDGSQYEAQIGDLSSHHDLARLDSDDKVQAPVIETSLPSLGEHMVFAGSPMGVARASVFPGMVSAVGGGLIAFPRIDLIQIAGMINNGNSGGPLLSEKGHVIGMITAKYVPLLNEIDRLRRDLSAIPQFPREVGIGQVDFSAFVNTTIQSLWQLAAVLRLVQVGTGWAVPSQNFQLIGVK